VSDFEGRVRMLIEKHPDLFPTEAKFWSYLRGCLRRGLWEKSPMKFKYKESQMGPPPAGYTGKGRKGTYCALTGVWTPTSKMEVDHTEGHIPLTLEEHVIPYIIHLLSTGGDELQMVDKEAHKIKSYADRMGLTFEEATIEKDVIKFAKGTKLQQSHTLKALKISPEKRQLLNALSKLTETT